MANNTANQYTISGTITNLHGKPLSNLMVRAFDRDPVSADDMLGQPATTDAKGNYLIIYTDNDMSVGGAEKGGADIYIQVYAHDKLLGQSPVSNNAKSKATIDLQIDDVSIQVASSTATKRRVFGVIRNQFGEVLNKASVEVYDRDIRHEQLLGTALTKEGKYEVSYTKEQFSRAEKTSADLVVKVVSKKGKQVLQQSAVFYNAPAELEVNLNLQGVDYKGPSEWEDLTNILTPLLDGLSPLELQENDKHQDISFLTGETEKSDLMIGNWLVAHHLADKTKQEKLPLTAEVCYGFLRQGQPGLSHEHLLQGVQENSQMELLKDKLLKGLAAIPAEQQKALLETAIQSNYISLRVQEKLDDTLDILRQIHLWYMSGSTFGEGKGSIGQLLELTPDIAPQKEAFLTALAEHTGSLDAFWEKLTTEKIIEPALVPQVKLSFDLAELTQSHVPLVAVLHAKFKTKGGNEALQQLAKNDEKDWIAVLKAPGLEGTPIGTPANMEGKTKKEKYQQFGAALAKRFEQTYPTTAFAGRLQKTKKSPVQHKAEMGLFLDNNPQFALEKHRIDHYLNENPKALEGINTQEAFVQELKAVQRVFKLSPRHEVVHALLNEKITSAQQVYFMGKEPFSNRLKQAGVPQLESSQMYQQAENTYAMVLNMVSNYHQAFTGIVPYGVGGGRSGFSSSSFPSNIQLKIDQLPNLRSLFGSLDYCECTHCRSVYSPAAYFVDMLRFFEQPKHQWQRA